MKNKLTLIIPFFNNLKQLDKCLKSIKQNSILPNEIILIDDGSSKKFKKNYIIKNCKIFIKKNNGPASARNLGIKKSKNDQILIADSDCWFPKNFFKNLDQHLNLQKNLAIPYKLNIQKTLIGKIIDIDIGYRYSTYNNKINLHGGYCLAFTKGNAKKIGHFNEFYKKPGGEDFEFSLKYSRKFSKFLFLKKLTIHTYHENNITNYLKKIFYRSEVHYELSRKNKLHIHEDNYSSNIDKLITLISPISIVLLCLKIYYLYLFVLIFDLYKNFKYSKYVNINFKLLIFLSFHIFNLIKSSVICVGLFKGTILNKSFYEKLFK